MAYFVVTILASWMIALAAGVIISNADMSLLWILWLTVPYTFLGLWGVIAVYLERKQEVLIDQTAEIKKSSWHYRLNQKVGGYNWMPPSTECQYWAKTFHVMLVSIPYYGVVLVVVYAIMLTIRFIASVIGFLISYQVAWGGNSFEGPEVWFAREGYLNRYKHQFWGPGLAMVLAIAWSFWTLPDLLPTVGVYLAVLAAMVGAGWLLRRVIWSVLRGLASFFQAVWQVVFVSGFGALTAYLLTRRVVCRKIRYVP